VLMIHVWSGVFVFLGVVFSKYLVNENRTMEFFYRNVFGLITNIFLNVLLIPKYGINGAAIATLICSFGVNYVYDIFDKRSHSQLKMKTKSFFPVHYFFKFK